MNLFEFNYFTNDPNNNYYFTKGVNGFVIYILRFNGNAYAKLHIRPCK